jgi:hypothetical protein
MATKTQAPTKTAPTQAVKYCTAMQQATADLCMKETFFKALFVKQLRTGRGVTNKLVGTKEEFDAAVAFLTEKLPTLEGAVKTQVATGLAKGWYDASRLPVYTDAPAMAAVAVTEPKAARKPSQNPRVLANRMVMARAKAIADRSQP